MLSLPAGHVVTADEFNVATGNEEGITVAGVADTTTSATYVNLAAVSSFSFTKILTATRLKIEFDVMFFVTVNDTSTRFGVLINGVDYDVVHMGGANVSASVNITAAGNALVASGLAAGTYTIQGRWKRTAGTGTCSRATNGWLTIHCKETG